MKVIDINNAVLSPNGASFRNPVTLSLERGEHLAITGPNASGKTLLAELISGKKPVCEGDARINGTVRVVSFTDSYGSADASYYYQQRWNHGLIDEETPTVTSVLEKLTAGNEELSALMSGLLCEFGLERCRDQYIISLSSGELRKFQMMKVLLYTPDILIVDNPFIGLDPSARETFSRMLENLSKKMTIILVIAREEEIPQFITHIVRMDNLTVGEKQPWKQDVPEILRFNDVTLSYGERTILKNFSWCVRKGEKWALTGENGSGKSLLLSLVCADNPMAYACDICLFGKPRGSGESIWEIKRRIGYVSPEMHRSFKVSSAGLDIVSSGFFDTIGTVRPASEAQRGISMEWMERFGIGYLARRSFRLMSSGEQRMCLLARAFVKDPELLVLDEPMHGLDEPSRMKVREIINRWASREDKTLIIVTHYMEELPSCIDRRLVLVKQ